MAPYRRQYFTHNNKPHLHHSQKFLTVHANCPLQQHMLVKGLFENSLYAFATANKADEVILKLEGQTFCFNLTYLYEVR